MASIASISPRSSFFIIAADKPNPQSQQTTDSTDSLSLNNATGTNSVYIVALLNVIKIQTSSCVLFQSCEDSDFSKQLPDEFKSVGGGGAKKCTKSES